MGRTSVILLPSTSENWSMVGDPQRGDGWFGLQTGSHTVQVAVQDLIGRVYIEATLATDPIDPTDWFPLILWNNLPYIEYPHDPNHPTGDHGGDRGTEAFTFIGNYVWLRARLDRTYIMPNPPGPSIIAAYGAVIKILLNQN